MPPPNEPKPPRDKGSVVAPRTHAQARRLGLDEIEIDFDKIDDEERANWIFLQPPGKTSRKGALAAIRPATAPIPASIITNTYPGPRDGVWIVCYFDTVSKREYGCHVVYSADPPSE